MTQALEQMLDNTFVPNIAQDRMYQTIDTYTSGTTALYTPPPKPFGLMNPQPFQMGYDLPGRNTQLHLHGPNPNTITHGHILDHNRNVLGNLNGYEASMASLNLDLNGYKKFP